MLIDPTKTIYYEPMLFSYLLTINIGILYVSSVKKWKALSFFSFLCTVIYFGKWYLSEYTPSDFRLAAGFAAGYFILFSFINTLHSIMWRVKSNREDLLLVILNPVIFFVIGYKMLIDRGSVSILPYLPLGMAIYHFILAGVVRRVNVRDVILYGGFMGTAIGLLALPVPMTVKSYWITVIWGAEAAVLIIAGSMIGKRALRTGGVSIFLLVIFRLFFMDPLLSYPETDHRLLFLNLKFLALFLSSLTFGLAALSFGRLKNLIPVERTYTGPLWSLFGISLFWITNLDLFSYFSHLTGIAGRMKWAYSSVLWSAFFLWLLLYGVLRRIKTLRVAGLCLMGATAVKILLLDSSILYSYYRYGYPFLFNLKFLSQLIFLGSIFVAAFLYSRKLKEGEEFEENALWLLWSAFIGMLFLCLNFEVFSYFGHIREAETRMMRLIFTTMLWTGFSCWFLLSGILRNRYNLRLAGFVFIGATAFKLFFIDTPLLYDYSYGYPFLLNLKFLSLALLLTTIAAGAVLYVKKGTKLENWERGAVPFLWSLFLVLLFVELHSQAALCLYQIWNLGEQRAAFALSFLWIIYGFGLLLVGMIKKILPLRISALSLFGVTLLKVLFVDLRFTGKLYKMYVLFGVGSILLTAAYFYRRYRKRLREKDS